MAHRAAKRALCPAEGLPSRGQRGGREWLEATGEGGDARRLLGVDLAASCLSLASGTGSPALTCSPRDSCLLPSAMRWLWPLAVSFVVVSAVGLSGVPGATPLHPGRLRVGALDQRSRLRRGTEDEEARGVQKYVPEAWAEFPRPIRPAGPQPTEPWVATSPHPDDTGDAPGSGPEPGGHPTGVPGQRLQMQNPLYPVTQSSYGAYAILLLALVLFAVGMVGNLAVMCVVGHSYHLKSAWNAILASLALWDFLVLFFCLPVVIFNELAKQRLLGDASCRAVPFLEVSIWGTGGGGHWQWEGWARDPAA